jgi:crotonobetaine/carnitine-CoA ligase
MGGWSNEPAGRRVDGEALTIPSVLDAQAAERPDQPLLYIDDQPLTYRGLKEGSIAAANVLADLGVTAGDRVALFMGTSAEWVTLWFGICRIGAVAVPVNTAYRGDFLARQLAAAGPVVVAVDQALEDRVAAVAAEVPTLQALLVRPDGSGAGPAAGGPLRRAGTDLLAAADGQRFEPAPGGGPAWNRPAAIFYTSGTTGASKGALATHHYLLSAAATMVDLWRLEPGETVYAPLPLFHLSAVGSVLGPMLAGGTGVLERAFSVHSTWDQVRRYGASGIALAGAMVTMLWNLPPDERDAELPLRFLSAAPVPNELYEPIQRRWGCRIVTCYGLSEAFPLTVAGVGDDNPPGASGRANPDFEVEVVDEDDRAVAPGEAGEIVCRPRRPHVMFEGYDGRDRETLDQLSNLWFHTGDLGRLDAEGNLYYVDRKKDAMRRRGENISSFEVEQALLRHPDVDEVAAVAVPSELGEDDVMVYVVPRAGATLDVVAFMNFCCERLPYFAVPRYVEVAEGLPKNAVGRVLKHELRAAGVPASAWDREEAGYVVRR